jgi:hypothetical protein
MYQIRCDDYILYDHRDEELIVLDPKCRLEVNTVGEGSFTILPTHPFYGALKKLKSVFEVRQDGQPIFRGRMTADSRDFHNQFFVDLEGMLAVTNDSIIPPFNFPGDFPEAENATNMVEYFLGWVLDQHNGQVENWQKLKLGNVTVTDPNNYITRSSEKYLHTWEVLKTKLFESTLGGYLCIRYEDDGNYVDYLDKFTLTNTQKIKLGENLLDFQNSSDASETYSAILPIGKDGLTLASLPDGDLTDDLVKKGNFIYSKSAVESYGWICVPVADSTWDDVTVVDNLKTHGMNHLTGKAMLLSSTITAKAVDLHFTDAQIQSFRIYRNILVDSPVHGLTDASFPLMVLDIDIHNPQNTVITVGDTSRTLVDINADRDNNVDEKIESTKNELKDYVSNTTKDLEQRIEGIDGTYFHIKYSPYSDGHVMTDVPDDTTMYMGTCSTSSSTAPTDYREYTWCRVRGEDGTNGTAGVDGSSQYFHVKYSDDGKTFTANNGETLGDWMGTCVNDTEADPTNFNAYTWKKIVGEDGKNGIDGVDGTDGHSSYFYVKFSANANGNPMTEAPTSTTKYMGVCSTTATTAPTDYSAYTWTQCRGEDGENGTPGAAGADGKTQYLHIKYSDDGKTFTGNMLPTDISGWESGYYQSRKYTQAYTITSTLIPVESGGRYAISRFSGMKTGVSQYSGEDGSTYVTATINSASDEEVTFTMGSNTTYVRVYFRSEDTTDTFETFKEAFASGEIVPYVYPYGSVRGEELGAYIGTLVDFVEADSNNFADYTWKKFTEDVDEELENIRQTITEQNTAVVNTAESIIMSALERYVETSNYEEFRQTVESELAVMAEQISMNFSTTTEQITNVNGDLQSVVEELEKHFEFSVDGLVIKGGEGSMELLLDNDLIRFMKNGQQFGWWDGVDFHTGNIIVKVNERAQFGNFAFVPRSNGSLSFLKVGG